MDKTNMDNGQKNLISERLRHLRVEAKLSQRRLAYLLQLEGIDMDKNVITRIETNKRGVADFELVALSKIFHVSLDSLVFGDNE